MGKKISRIFIFTITLVFAIVICGVVSAADADIQVNQTVNNSSPNYNDTVKFTTTVSNNGPNNANGVQITTKLPDSTIYVSDDSNGAYNSTTGIWNIGDITYGSTAKTLNIIARVNATGTIDNLALKTAQTENDPVPTNNYQEVTLNVPQTVDIVIYHYLWFTPKSGTFDASNTPTFTVDVRNMATNNMDDATNVVIEYLIADGYEYISCDTRGNGYTQLITDTTGKVTTIIWTIPYMPKGSTDILNGMGGAAFMNVFLRALDTGTKTTNLTNTAMLLSVDQYDINSANNKKIAATSVATAHDIQVNQTYNTYSVDGKNYVIYVITVSNNGPDDATGVQIRDILPTDLIIVGNPIASQGSYDQTTGIWNIGNVAYGATNKTLTIVAQILDTTEIIKNTATLISPIDFAFTDWNYNNNAQTTVIIPSETTYTPKTNIILYNYLWATPSSGIFDASNTPTYTVDVRNMGNTDEYDDATNVVVEFQIADGYEYIACDTRGNGYTQLITDTTGKVTTIIWTIPYMPKGSTDILNGMGGAAFMNVFLRALDTGTKTTNLTNTATLLSPTYTSQPTKSASTSVSKSADIQINQIITGTTNYQDTVVITITATNNGPDDSTGLTIRDLLPAGLAYISYTASSGTYNSTTGIWNIGTFTYGSAPKTLQITAKINTTGTIKNTAAITSPIDFAFTDWNYNNNAKTCVIEVPKAADIAVNQSSTHTTPTFGDTITYTITAINNGPDIAYNIKISDLLPSGLKYLSYVTSYGSYNSTTGIWTIGSLLNGEIATLKLIANVTSTTQNAIIINTATKLSENQYDWNTTNNQNSTTMTVDLGSTVTMTDTDDGHSTTGYQIPFTVNLLGTNYTTGTGSNNYKLWIDVNGFVYFSKDGVIDSTDYYIRKYGTNTAYPIWMAHVPSYVEGTYGTIYNKIPMIAAFWDDLDLSEGGTVYIKNTGDNVTITYVNVPSYHEVYNYENYHTTITEFNTFQIRITSDGHIAFIYGDMEWANDWYGQYSNTLGRTVYPYAFAGLNKGDASTYSQIWTGSQSLSQIANHSIWL